MRDELNDLLRAAAWDAANKAPVWRDPVLPDPDDLRDDLRGRDDWDYE